MVGVGSDRVLDEPDEARSAGRQPQRGLQDDFVAQPDGPVRRDGELRPMVPRGRPVAVQGLLSGESIDFTLPITGGSGAFVEADGHWGRSGSGTTRGHTARGRLVVTRALYGDSTSFAP